MALLLGCDGIETSSVRARTSSSYITDTRATGEHRNGEPWTVFGCSRLNYHFIVDARADTRSIARADEGMGGVIPWMVVVTGFFIPQIMSTLPQNR